MEVVLPDGSPEIKDLILSSIKRSVLDLDMISSYHLRCFWNIDNFIGLNDIMERELILEGVVKSQCFGIGVGGRFRLVLMPRSVNLDGLLHASLSLEMEENSSPPHTWYQLSIMQEDLVELTIKTQGRSTLGRQDECLRISLEKLLSPELGYLVKNSVKKKNSIKFYAEVCVLHGTLLKGTKELEAKGFVIDKNKKWKGQPFAWVVPNFEFFFSQLGDQDIIGLPFQLGKDRLQLGNLAFIF